MVLTRAAGVTGTTGGAGGQQRRPAVRYAYEQEQPGHFPPAREVTWLLVAGAHGGAGTSTLAALLRHEAGGPPGHPALLKVRGLPALPDGDPRVIARRTALPARLPGPLILTARGNADGVRRAVVAVTALEHLGIRPAALAIVGDGAGPVPRAAAERLALIGDRAGPVVNIPFAASLRTAASLPQARVPAALSRAVTSLAGLLTRGGWL